MVVLPAASKPTMRMRISFLENSRPKTCARCGTNRLSAGAPHAKVALPRHDAQQCSGSRTPRNWMRRGSRAPACALKTRRASSPGVRRGEIAAALRQSRKKTCRPGRGAQRRAPSAHGASQHCRNRRDATCAPAQRGGAGSNKIGATAAVGRRASEARPRGAGARAHAPALLGARARHGVRAPRRCGAGTSRPPWIS